MSLSDSEEKQANVSMEDENSPKKKQKAPKPSSKNYGCDPSDPLSIPELKKLICYWTQQYKRGTKGQSRKHWEKVSDRISDTTGAQVTLDWLRKNQNYVSTVLMNEVDIQDLPVTPFIQFIPNANTDSMETKARQHEFHLRRRRPRRHPNQPQPK